VGRPYPLYPKASVRLPVAQKNRFFSVTAIQHTL